MGRFGDSGSERVVAYRVIMPRVRARCYNRLGCVSITLTRTFLPHASNVRCLEIPALDTLRPTTTAATGRNLIGSAPLLLSPHTRATVSTPDGSSRLQCIDRFGASLQGLDNADERISPALADEPLGSEAHDRPPDGVSLVAADAESKRPLRIVSNLDDDHRVGFVLRVCSRMIEGEPSAATIVLNDVAYVRGVNGDLKTVEYAPFMERILNRAVDEHRVPL